MAACNSRLNWPSMLSVSTDLWTFFTPSQAPRLAVWRCAARVPWRPAKARVAERASRQRCSNANRGRLDEPAPAWLGGMA